MHEMAISESILGILEAEAARQKFARVKRVFLEIGPFSTIEPDALRFTFGVVTKGTVAENAGLDIETPQASAWCLACSASVPVAQRYDPCPMCGGHQLQITSGDEMRIKELEVE